MKLLACLALVACASMPQTAPQPAPVPDSINLPAGPVKVTLVDSLYYPANPDLTVLGRYDPLARTIYVSKKITSPLQRRKTLMHEVCHAALIDTGLHNVLHNTVAPEVVELICDAFAAALLQPEG